MTTPTDAQALQDLKRDQNTSQSWDEDNFIAGWNSCIDHIAATKRLALQPAKNVQDLQQLITTYERAGRDTTTDCGDVIDNLKALQSRLALPVTDADRAAALEWFEVVTKFQLDTKSKNTIRNALSQVAVLHNEGDLIVCQAVKIDGKMTYWVNRSYVEPVPQDVLRQVADALTNVEWEDREPALAALQPYLTTEQVPA